MCQFRRFGGSLYTTCYKNPEYRHCNCIITLCRCGGERSEGEYGLNIFENRVLTGTETEECEFA